MTRVFLKPAPGRVVPYPEQGRNLNEEGEWISINQYWQRRINDGDVIKVKPNTKGDK